MKSMLIVIFILTVLTVCYTNSEAKGWKQKEFIITMWCPPPATDQETSILARDHYTVTQILPETPEEAIRSLDTINKHKIKVLLTNRLFSPESLDDPVKKTELDTFIDKVKNHPALEGYHLVDEPSAEAFHKWAKLTAYLKEKDPIHLAYINVLPTYGGQQLFGVFKNEEIKGPTGIPENYSGVESYKNPIILYNEYLRQYIDVVKPELLSYDHYHFMNDGIDGGEYFLNLAMIRQAALSAKIPFLNIVQACTIEHARRLPNEHELRWLAFTTLAYGGKGISWFIYWGNKVFGGLYQDCIKTPTAEYVAAVNRDVLSIGNEMLDMESTGVYHTGKLPLGTGAIPVNSPVKVSGNDFILGLFSHKGIQNVFMLVNRDYRKINTAKLTLNFGKGQLQEFNSNEGKWIDIQFVYPGSTINITLSQGDGKLFRIR